MSAIVDATLDPLLTVEEAYPIVKARLPFATRRQVKRWAQERKLPFGVVRLGQPRLVIAESALREALAGIAAE